MVWKYTGWESCWLPCARDRASDYLVISEYDLWYDASSFQQSEDKIQTGVFQNLCLWNLYQNFEGFRVLHDIESVRNNSVLLAVLFYFQITYGYWMDLSITYVAIPLVIGLLLAFIE